MHLNSFTSEERQALIEFGFELYKARWEPEAPLVENFGNQSGSDGKWYGLAIAFVKQNRVAFQERICKGEAVKLEIQTSTTIIASVADAIQSIVGLPLPTMTIANILCLLGLNKFCAWNPGDKS